MDQNEVIPQQAAAAASVAPNNDAPPPAAAVAAGAPFVQDDDDDDHRPMKPLGGNYDEDTVLEHPDYLDLNGVNPDHLPPDHRPPIFGSHIRCSFFTTILYPARVYVPWDQEGSVYERHP